MCTSTDYATDVVAKLPSNLDIFVWLSYLLCTNTELSVLYLEFYF